MNCKQFNFTPKGGVFIKRIKPCPKGTKNKNIKTKNINKKGHPIFVEICK